MALSVTMGPVLFLKERINIFFTDSTLSISRSYFLIIVIVLVEKSAIYLASICKQMRHVMFVCRSMRS